MTSRDEYFSATRVVSVRLKRSHAHYKSKGVLYLGIIQIFLGLFSIALGISHVLTYSVPMGYVGYGIWAGVIYCSAGILGFVSGKRDSTVLILVHMTLSIIATVLAALQVCLAVTSAYHDNLTIKGILNWSDYLRSYYQVSNKPYAGTVVVDSLLAVSGFIEFFVATVAASLGCSVTCCNNNFVAAQQVLNNLKNIP